METIQHQQPVARMSRDLRQIHMSDEEARLAVDAYYSMQANRIMADNQKRALQESGEPVAILDYLGEQSAVLENQARGALERYAKGERMGRWLMAHKGVGPVIAAGLLAHLTLEIDGQRVNTVSSWWSFAGLDPSREWKKGQKRPWNASLKTLCWKLGESFVKVSGYEDAFYGQLYKQRKAFEVAQNEAGRYADQAALKLERQNIGKTTEAYKHYVAGRLPPAHIHARAKRWAVKLFLSHYFDTAYRNRWGEEPPKPYVFAILGHADKIEPPAISMD